MHWQEKSVTFEELASIPTQNTFVNWQRDRTVGREGLLQRCFKGGEFALSTFPAVFGLAVAGCLEPFLDRVARQPSELCNGAVGEFVAQFHAPDLAYHVHGDHLRLLPKNSVGQWNTLVNFELALMPIDGQLSVGVNKLWAYRRDAQAQFLWQECGP